MSPSGKQVVRSGARKAFRARWALTPGRPPIENALLQVFGDRVESLGYAKGAVECETIDLGDVLLLPGLVNAHTHLELTSLRGQIPYGGSFAEWLERLIVNRPREFGIREARESLKWGVEQSLRAGVTTVGDIGYGRHQIETLAPSPLRGVCWLEILGIGVNRDAALSRLSGESKGMEALPPKLWLGISPHAPYSTDAEVYRQAVAQAKAAGWTLCTHLAETPEEREFLIHGTGPLRDMLDSRRLLGAAWEPPGCGPIEFARGVGLLDSRAVLVHVNDVTDAELEILAGTECSVVYCPRTHQFFEHGPHRYREMMTAGLNVCLGTDSLASNDSLSIPDEWRFLHARDPSLDFETLLAMSTINGARAMGIERWVGALEPGRLADFVTLDIGSCSSLKEAQQRVLGGAACSIGVTIGGIKVRT